MKLGIVFGLDTNVKYIDWPKSLHDFPKLLLYSGRKWEWFMYKDGPNGIVELNFTEIPKYDPNYYVDDIECFEDMFGFSKSTCECGAIWSSFSWDHMRFCKLWKPW
jgi:hypothetical protein